MITLGLYISRFSTGHLGWSLNSAFHSATLAFALLSASTLSSREVLAGNLGGVKKGRIKGKKGLGFEGKKPLKSIYWRRFFRYVVLLTGVDSAEQSVSVSIHTASPGLWTRAEALSPDDLGDLARMQLQPVACIICPASIVESELASQQFPFKAHLFRFFFFFLTQTLYVYPRS